MNKKIIVLGSIVVFTIGGYIFIKTNNDHKECSNVKSITTDKNGNQVVSEKHVCKEKYSF